MNRRRASGFSLLEVIAAILLLAIAFAALMRVAGSSLNLTASSAEYTRAALWGRTKLDSVGQLDALRVGQSEGSFDEAYRWRLAVVRWRPEQEDVPNGGALQLYKLDLDVVWGPESRHRTAHFSTLRLAVEVPVNPGLGSVP
jgi:general secretion pathway protein I